jgi:Ca2+-binding RTX toxin-like protein
VPQTINGTAGPDILNGTDPGNPGNTDGIDIINGLAGNDTLSGLGGNDDLDGGLGADILNGGAGVDSAFYDTSSAGVTVDLRSGTGLGGDAEGDTLTDIENVIGSGFADVFVASAAANFFFGGARADTVSYAQSTAGVTINLRAGVVGVGGDAQGDRLPAIENLIGSAHDDILVGDGVVNDVNVLDGGAGNDLLEGLAGADTLQGGAGTDTATYVRSIARVTVDLTSGMNSGGDAGGDVLTSIENLIGSAFADTLRGDGGANALSGGGGDDTLHGGAGGDALDGGAGSDFANYQGSAAVSVNLLTGDTSGGDAQGDTLTGIENLYGSSNADQLTGDNARNIIGGEFGDDTIVGNGGDDALSGEAGNDSLDGGDGADRLVGGAGIDTVHGGIGNDSIDAGSEADQVFGEAGNDNILGGGGNDQIDGGDGNDTLEGAVGGDTLIGGAGIDTASYAGSGTGVSVNMATGIVFGGDAVGDTFSGIEQVLGSGFADTLTGNAGANMLWGMGGGDVLTGGGGADVLKGGAGADRFVYAAIGDSTVAAAGKDTIRDFSAGDRIDLSAIDANGAGPGDTAFTLGTGAFTAAGQVRVLDFGGGRYGVYLETTGNRVEDAIITVFSDHALTAADFVL